MREQQNEIIEMENVCYFRFRVPDSAVRYLLFCVPRSIGGFGETRGGELRD